MFDHLAGVTTPGAPDEVIDWFTTFEAWMLTLGWTVAAGAGTQDIFFESVGEVGGLTMLFIHVWRDLGFVNRVHLEVCDDIVPTHQTGEGGYVDSGGVQFAFWLTGDMDAIVVCWKVGAGYNTISAGLVLPFALTIPDETYQMVVTNRRLDQGSILRDFNNVWDVDHNTYDSDAMDDVVVDPKTGELTMAGRYFNQGANIGGQFRHITARINDPGPTAEDTITTGMPGATTTWIILQDSIAQTYGMRTGGILPTGVTDGNFAGVAGVAASPAALAAAITAFAIGRGWTSEAIPAWWPPASTGGLYHSTGMSGLEDIWAGFFYQNLIPGRYYSFVQLDLAGTQHTQDTNQLSLADFPINYFISGDLDCLIVVYQIATGYNLNWTGLSSSFAPSLATQTEYSAVYMGCGWPLWGGGVLRNHSEAWASALTIGYDGVPSNNSNPNSFDGVTYQVWPIHMFQVHAGGNYPIGQLKYIGFTRGGGVANMDTITVGAQIFTVFFAPAGNPFPAFCLRTT